MAHVSGPTSSMPGSLHRPEGADCDNHPGTPAVARRQGETDSMGAEYADLCQARLDAERAAYQQPVGRCDWCGAADQPLFARRDYDEGMAGPIYQVCRACIVKENAEATEELAQWNEYEH